MTIEAIDHVNIRAPAGDIANLKAFYCDVVGLLDGWRPAFESRGHWLYAGDHPLVHLVEDERSASAKSRAGVDHVSFRSAALEPIVERLRSRGIEFRMALVPTLGHRQIQFRDPIGTGVEITAPPAGG